MLPLSKNQSPVYRNFATKYFFGVALNADSKDYKYSCVSTAISNMSFISKPSI
jgi:hypothetical protein